jgi:hypothetical protein
MPTVQRRTLPSTAASPSERARQDPPMALKPIHLMFARLPAWMALRIRSDGCARQESHARLKAAGCPDTAAGSRAAHGIQPL